MREHGAPDPRLRAREAALVSTLRSRFAAVVAILATGAVFTTCRESQAPRTVPPQGPAFATSADTVILFQDNFETGTAAGWNATAGTWSVVQDGGSYVYRNSDRKSTRLNSSH